jgi:hypothetical protein
MNSSALNPATHETSLFLLHDKDNSEIVTPSILLPFDQDNSAIMAATHASLLLPFNQDNPAITTAIQAQNLLLLSVQDDPAITMMNHTNPKLQIVECLFLLRNEDNSETMTSSFLLFCIKDTPAIMTAPLANFSLQLIVESLPTGAKQASICNNSFKLIDMLASEGAALCSEGTQPAPTISSNELHGRGLIVDLLQHLKSFAATSFERSYCSDTSVESAR